MPTGVTVQGMVMSPHAIRRNAQHALRVGPLLLLAVLFTASARQQSAPPILRIYLARHGETDWNVEGRTQGWTDTPLNATGRQQAMQLKTKLSGIPIDAAYSSTLSRSKETAQIAFGTEHLTNLPDLRERNFGTFQGKVSTDPQVAPDYERRRWLPDDSLSGGESLNMLEQRVRAALATVRREHPSGSVLVVGHGHTNQVILKQVFNLSIEQTRRIAQANDEVYLIELQQGSEPRLWKLIVSKNLMDL